LDISTDGKEISVSLEDKADKIFKVSVPNSYDSK